MNEKQILENAKKLGEIHEKRNQAFNSWLKNIITIAAGLIAVLVSLKTGKSPSLLAHYLFVSTIGLLSLGILSGSLVLYNEVHLLSKARELQLDYTQKLLNDSSVDLLEWISNAWYYVPSKWISLLSFSISLVTLTWYAFLIDI